MPLAFQTTTYPTMESKKRKEMSKLEFANINTILNRNHIEEETKRILLSFDKNYNNLNFKKGIYIYGSPGSGKTEFVMNLLTSCGYDVIRYDAGDVRNKMLIKTIASDNMSNKNVLQIMSGVTKKIAIVMDEIDGMNNGDKGGITSLIKLIRQKKTKKQQTESKTINPIICIGNYNVDKKIKELMKVCHVFELQMPTDSQLKQLLEQFLTPTYTPLIPDLLKYIQGDLRKLHFVQKMYTQKPHLLTSENIQNFFQAKTVSKDARQNICTLFNNPVSIDKHITLISETDRTTVAHLWHENIIDQIQNIPIEKSFPFYSKILQNMCFADYICRISFQIQTWQFTEMGSLIKTFHNNKIFHDTFPEKRGTFHSNDIRFTKILTKFSTEFNNINFIYKLCQELDLDKKDLIAFFQELRFYFGDMFMSNIDKIIDILFSQNNYEIKLLEVKRLYRYLDKNAKKTDIVMDIDEDDDDTDDAEVMYESTDYE